MRVLRRTALCAVALSYAGCGKDGPAVAPGATKDPVQEYIEKTRQRIEAANLPKAKDVGKKSKHAADSIGETSDPLSND